MGLLLPQLNSPERKRQVLFEARRMVSSFSAQVAWRFMEFVCFPYRWAAYAHPAAAEESRDAVLQEFFDSSDCCRGRDFCKKVRAYT